MSRVDEDPELRALCVRRRNLLARLAPLLTRVGASYDDRSARNRERAASRRELRAALKANAQEIVARCMAMTVEARA